MKSTGREMKRTESFEGKGFKELWATNQEVSNTLDLCCASDDEGLPWQIRVTLTAAKRYRHIFSTGE